MPKPATSKALQPAMPITVMKKRFLYRKIFRAVTFQLNEKCDHSSGTRSSRIFLPIFGALGRISWLGTSISSLYTAANAASIVTPMTRPLASSMSPGCSTNFSSGRLYMRFHALKMTLGKIYMPSEQPRIEPNMPAMKAYIRYFIAMAPLL